MIYFGPILEHRLMFEWPMISDQFPCGMIADAGKRFSEIRREICTKIEATVRCGVGGSQIQKRRLHNPMFMMANLWPRIRKQNEYIGNARSGRKRFQKQLRLGTDKMKIW